MIVGNCHFRFQILVYKMDSTLQMLPDDLVFDIFKRLQTNYLYLIAETCTRFLDLTSIEYRRRHPEKFACISIVDERIVLHPKDDDVQVFGRKFLNLIVHSHGRHFRLEDDLLRFILFNCSVNLQMLRFQEAMLHVDQLQAMQHMLHRIETLVLHKCGMNDDFYDYLLRHCQRVKHLIVSDSYGIVEPTGNKWLHQTYPALETVQLCSITMASFCYSHWETFFLLNPQITSFSCDHWCLIDSLDRPIKAIARNAKNLQRLYISLRGIGHLNTTFSDLLGLCQQKQFQRLEIQLTGETGIQYLIRHLKILRDMSKLRALHLTCGQFKKEAATPIATLANLTQLTFTDATFDIEFGEILSKNMQNLEEIHCDTGANDFTPFVRFTPTLKKIVLANTEMSQLNLGWGPHWLSSERQSIPGACPITFYVKISTIGGNELTTLTCGIVTIKSIVPNKSVLLIVDNTFVDFKVSD